MKNAFFRKNMERRSITIPVNWLQTGTTQMDTQSSHSGTSGESQCFCQEDNQVSVPHVPSVSPYSPPRSPLPLWQSTTQVIKCVSYGLELMSFHFMLFYRSTTHLNVYMNINKSPANHIETCFTIKSVIVELMLNYSDHYLEFPLFCFGKNK